MLVHWKSLLQFVIKYFLIKRIWSKLIIPLEKKFTNCRRSKILNTHFPFFLNLEVIRQIYIKYRFQREISENIDRLFSLMHFGRYRRLTSAFKRIWRSHGRSLVYGRHQQYDGVFISEKKKKNEGSFLFLMCWNVFELSLPSNVDAFHT